MNKTYKSGMMALSAVVFFISCSENESLQQAHLSTDQINFIASMAHQWDANTKSAPQNPSSRSAGVRDNEAPIHVNANLAKPLYLHPVVQDGIHIWSKQGTPITRSGAPIEDVEQERVVQTRGSKKDNLSAYSNFGVTALYQNGDAYESLFSDAIATNSGKYWNIPDASNHTWPIESKVSFHAYAPHSSESNSMLSSSHDLANVQTNIHYTASSADIVNQPDLIVATNAAQRSKTAANTPVDLQFSHALTAVSFAMSSDLSDVIGNGAQLTSVSLQNIPNEGDCQLIAQDDKHTSSSAIWKLDSDKKGTYTFDLSAKNVSVGSNLALTDDNQTLMMIPQTLPDGAKLEFTFNLNNKTQVLTVDLKGQEWKAGQSVIYKLSAKAINTLDATAVTYPSTWTASSFPKESFTTNDAIGLYVVDKNNQIVEKNVKLTLGSNNQWTSSKKFLKLAGYKYFAYYPYSDTKAPAVNTDATNTATDFFASKISSLSPASDQSAQNTLLAQDFQVAKGVVASDASTLTFPMEHSLGLAVLNLTDKTVADTRRFKDDTYRYYYGLDNTVPTTSNYTDTGSKTLTASNNFEGNKPYNVSGTKYLQVIPLNKATSFKAADQAGAPRTAWGKLSTKLCSITPTTSAPVSINIQTDADFYYLARVYTCTQKVEEFTAPVSGEYKLECWGASGHSVFGEDTALPGLGGYAAASYQIKTNHIIYICAGGYANGYNNKCDYTGGGLGGGATSITIEIGAELKELSNKQDKDKVLLVAGGGGGIERPGKAGSGGGLEGLDGVSTFGEIQAYGTGGTQNAGGLNNQGNAYPIYLEYKACFGAGGIAARDTGTSTNPRMDFGAQGGGGWYGGGGTGFAGAAGGGSSYGNTSLLVKGSFVTIDGDNKMPSPYGGTEIGHLGHGACVISWFLKQ